MATPDNTMPRQPRGWDPDLTPPLLLAGPTASGKSAVALALAEQLGGEIVSVDSMQVYRGLDIGTAKPSPAERARVPHHLIDVVDLPESFDAGQFASMAGEAVRAIQSRGRVAILCGGTGLYFRAFLEGVGNAPRAEPALHAELQATPLAKLLEELAARDPAGFAAIDQRNPRRVIRAVEVIRLTGRPYSEQRVAWSDPASQPPGPPFFGLARDPEDLRQRIHARVDTMFEQGLVDETRELLSRGLAECPTALQAIGYRQVVEHLRGERDLQGTREWVKARTRQYVRRQMTWFRHQSRIEWIPVAADAKPEEVARTLARRNYA